jgi:CRISPR-associated endonuclease Csn1
MYSYAMEYAGYNHSNSLTTAQNEARTLLEKLPQLQKNSLRQPVVEKILNQMINVVNAIIDEYGKPDEIRVELARELKSSKYERNTADKINRAREADNKKIAERLEKDYNV